MDYVRSCYSSNMRLYNDRPEILTPGQWYFCKPGAKLIPYTHAFCSREWDDYRIKGDDPLIGEVGPRGPYTDGVAPDRLDGLHWCGDAEVWRIGVQFGADPLPRWPDGVPICCDTGPPPPQFELEGDVAIDGSAELLEATGDLAIDGSIGQVVVGQVVGGDVAIDGSIDQVVVGQVVGGDVAIDGSIDTDATADVGGDVALDGGIADVASFSGVEVLLAAPVTVANATDTVLSWGSAGYDTDGYWSIGTPTEIVAPFTGWYHCTGFASWPAASGGDRECWIELNGSSVRFSGVTQLPVVGGNTEQVVSCDVQLDAGDFLELVVRQSAGAPIVGVFTVFWVHLIGV
jgi:hypothetical protein